MKTEARKRAIRLEASEETLYYPDGSFEDSVLLELLREAWERKIPQHRRILATEKRRDMRLNEWGYDGAYVFPLVRVPLRELTDLWKTLWGASDYKTYTPENEDERSAYEINMLEKRAAFPAAMGAFMRAVGIEMTTGKPQGALIPLGRR